MLRESLEKGTLPVMPKPPLGERKKYPSDFVDRMNSMDCQDFYDYEIEQKNLKYDLSRQIVEEMADKKMKKALDSIGKDEE